MRMFGWKPYQAVSIVDWCGHLIEWALIPERPGWSGTLMVNGEGPGDVDTL
jgi:hypothetical protein